MAKSKISPRKKFPSLLVNKLIFFSSKYIKPVKSSCNSIMFRTNPSLFEKTLSKNSPHPSNECLTRRENPQDSVCFLNIVRVKQLKQ